ncbi:MAG: Flp pilus assembly protein CpaB [Gemmataceae bacterium]
MRGSNLVLIVASGVIFVAVAAMMGLMSAWRASRSAATPAPDAAMIEVLVPIQDIPLGERITEPERHFEKKPVAKSAAPAQVVTAWDQLKDKYAAKDLPAGQPIRTADLSAQRVFRIAPGHRAVVIRVAVEKPALAKLSAARVDVLHIVQAGSSATIQRLLDNRKILAIEELPLQPDTPHDKVLVAITLEATPEQESKLREAEQTGILTIQIVG